MDKTVEYALHVIISLLYSLGIKCGLFGGRSVWSNFCNGSFISGTKS